MVGPHAQSERSLLQRARRRGRSTARRSGSPALRIRRRIEELGQQVALRALALIVGGVDDLPPALRGRRHRVGGQSASETSSGPGGSAAGSRLHRLDVEASNWAACGPGVMSSRQMFSERMEVSVSLVCRAACRVLKRSGRCQVQVVQCVGGHGGGCAQVHGGAGLTSARDYRTFSVLFTYKPPRLSNNAK